jgi:2-(1,2-epoxy-1,2-dihydrophenyl)acetyl-CoA isomerase
MRELNNFQIDIDDGIAWMAMDSDTEMNSLNAQMIEEFLHLITDFGEDDGVRCMVLRGSDSVFSAGGNISSFEDGSEAAANFRFEASLFHTAVAQLKRVETPLVTGIDGPAVGAGFSLALLGDISLMREGAYLQYGYSTIGLTGDGSSTFYLPRIVGLQEAKRIALLNEQIESREASELGLVTETADAESFENRLAEIADRIADGPTKAQARIRRMLEETFARQLPDQLAEETDRIVQSSQTDDFAEGVSAFEQGREPEFEGQ